MSKLVAGENIRPGDLLVFSPDGSVRRATGKRQCANDRCPDGTFETFARSRRRYCTQKCKDAANNRTKWARKKAK